MNCLHCTLIVGSGYLANLNCACGKVLWDFPVTYMGLDATGLHRFDYKSSRVCRDCGSRGDNGWSECKDGGVYGLQFVQAVKSIQIIERSALAEAS